MEPRKKLANGSYEIISYIDCIVKSLESTLVLKQNGYYIVEKESLSNYGECKYDRIKLKGIAGMFLTSGFELVSQAVLRKAKIGTVLGTAGKKDKINIITDYTKKREIDSVNNKTEVLFSLIMQEVTGLIASNLLFSWKLKSLDKICKYLINNDTKYSLRESDFEEIGNMTLNEILNSNFKKPHIFNPTSQQDDEMI